MSQIWNAQFVLNTQHKSDNEPGTGVHKDPNDAAGGLTKSFLEIRLPYVRLVHYPGSAPAKTWKCSKRWVGPYKIQAKTGFKYIIRSKEGEDRVVHHNNVKACPVPYDKGKTLCPGKEYGEVEFLPREIEPEGENRGVLAEHEGLQLFQRPTHLRQVMRPHVWFGDFVTQ